MKSTFPGYYQLSDTAFESIWKEGSFAFDANVLLDFHRYSDASALNLLKLFESLDDRVWIPYQAAYEYHKNLLTVLATEAKSYSEAVTAISNLKSSFSQERGHPFLSKNLQKQTLSLFSKLAKELGKKEQEMISLNRPIHLKLSSLLKGRVGEPFSEEELTAIYKEGEIRYAKKTPPGYADSKDKKGNEMYGDYVIWKEILKKAGTLKTPLVFVTRDTKEDWFASKNGRIICPRPELITEVNKISDISFYIYSLNSFIDYANQYLTANVTKDTIDEVSRVGQRVNAQMGLRSVGDLTNYTYISPASCNDTLANIYSHSVSSKDTLDNLFQSYPASATCQIKDFFDHPSLQNKSLDILSTVMQKYFESIGIQPPPNTKEWRELGDLIKSEIFRKAINGLKIPFPSDDDSRKP